ncbi:MAG: S49 family peptidase [Alphaproteobacteria bacterium]|nr:S49 family peptidase [Alphaproteobacteria bacterium]
MPGLPSQARQAISRLPFVGPKRPLINVIDLNGPIGAASRGRGLSFARVRPLIESAFKPSGLTAVALSINSPGGSPVQSRLIFAAIRRAAEKKKVPVLAFIEDVGASGGYILALAADEIIADESSIVGSIGVISAGFGFAAAIARIGIERRVHTAGAAKSQLDPFVAEDPEDVARLEAILSDLHEQFIDLVKERRGDRLDGSFEDTFTGAFWTASDARTRGLVDETGRLDDFLKTRFGEKARIKRLSPRGSPLLRALGGAGAAAIGRPAPVVAIDAGAIDVGAAIDALEERALWGRFGLGG